MNIWEKLERLGLILMILGFALLGWLGWSLRNDINAISRKLPITNYQLPITENPCDQNCVRTLVSEAIATISGISQPIRQEVVERVVEKVQTVTVSQPKTQYIPLGSGSTSNVEWTDVPGAQVTFNLSDFGTIAAIYFEAQLKSASGKVFARLWDSQVGGLISSEVSHIAGDAQSVSTPVSIATGGRTIKVQLRSEVKQPVELLSSRLRIDSK